MAIKNFHCVIMAKTEEGAKVLGKPVKIRAATYQMAFEQFVNEEIEELAEGSYCIRVMKEANGRYVEHYIGQTVV